LVSDLFVVTVPMDVGGKGKFRYCPECRRSLVPKTFNGKERLACPSCDFVHWNNPKTVSSVIVPGPDGNSILLVKRGIEPRKGWWALPGGFVDEGEGHEEGGIREVKEETGIIVTLERLLASIPLRRKNEVLNFYVGTAIGGELTTSNETLEVKYFPLDQLPEVAFPSHQKAIEMWRAERAKQPETNT
jgi:ADP-ribose pyrophosphatase YjhB (NUDIX family)